MKPTFLANICKYTYSREYSCMLGYMTVHDDATAMHEDLVQLRRALHAEPELGLQLPRTQEKVLAALQGLPLTLSLGKSLDSITAVLRGSKPGPTVLLRGDMDALPVVEETGLDFASTNGNMHACGHDLHTTMLTGAAHLLAARKNELAGDVVFMFQPGEEGLDGARHMLEEGLLDASGSKPEAAFGLHVISSGSPSAQFATRRGPLMASSDTVVVTVNGVGGHGSAPHLAKDPIPVACEMVLALQTLITRSTDPRDPVVITVGSFHAGTKQNIIPSSARFDATVRAFDSEVREHVKKRISQVVKGIASAHDMTADVDYTDLYPVTVNNGAEAEYAANVIDSTLGSDRFAWAPKPVTGSEDFSKVLNEVPGAFIFLSASKPDSDYAKAAYNHSPLAYFDESVLVDGATIYAELALGKIGA
jgi:hippurate hydrolase